MLIIYMRNVTAQQIMLAGVSWKTCTISLLYAYNILWGHNRKAISLNNVSLFKPGIKPYHMMCGSSTFSLFLYCFVE